MADLSKVKLNGVTYNFKDKKVRDFLKKGWIPAGMEAIVFSEQPVYDNCAILVAEDENNIETFFYSGDNGEWNGVGSFYSLDGQKIILDTNNHIYYYNNGIDNTKIYSGMEGFPNIYYGYMLPTEIGTIVIEKENNEYQFSSDQEDFDWWNIITNGYDSITMANIRKTLWKIIVYDNNNALPILYYSYVDYENNLIHFTSLPQPNGIIYQLTINNQNEISLTSSAGGVDLSDYVQKTDLATSVTNGLMSAADKQMLDSMNPNISVTISDIYASETHIINAKQENMVDLEIIESPHISERIRTSNLLNVSNFTPGFYIGANGSLSSNANDRVGDFIPVSPGDDIYYTGIIGPTNSSSVNRRLHIYNANQTWIKQLSFAANLKVGDHWSTHGVIPSNGAYVRVSWGVEDYNVMLSVGAPDKYWPYYVTPFSSIPSASFQLSPDDTYTNATTYTVTVPAAAGNLYGFRYNPIAGKLYATTGHIASYNGETLPSTNWYSDRDTYAEGTTPSTGAEVVYQLADEDIVEYDITPQTIPMFFHVNYIKTDTGVIVSFSYYAETFGVSHITVSNGATIGETNILESDVQGWNQAAELINTKANIASPEFTGSPTAPTPGAASNTQRIATTEFVQRMMNNIAPVEANINRASKNYEVGEYLFASGQFYKVTAAVAQNTAFTPGTNVVATTVMAEIVSLLS